MKIPTGKISYINHQEKYYTKTTTRKLLSENYHKKTNSLKSI